VFAATEMKPLLQVVASYLQQTLQNRAVVIFTRGPSNPSFSATANVGIAGEILGRIRFEPECRLINYLGTAFDPQECDLPDAEREQLRDLKSSLIVPIRLRGELIGFLSLGCKISGEAYDAQTREFLTTVAEQTAADIDRIRLLSLQREALDALEIQLRLLPNEIPQVPGYQISGSWKPTQLVSGDYYDVLKFGDHSVGLCIGDVVGHGLPAAMLMANLQAAVHAFASETIGPSQLCMQINRLLARNIGVGKFITFFYALVDAGSNRLLYTNAGHNAPILLRPTGAVLRLDEGGTLLGVFPEVAYREKQVELAPGDRLLLFTDGVSEAQNTDSEEFGEARLIEVLTNNRSRDAIDIQKAVIQAVTEFSNGDFHDDVTTLVVAVL
jgi:phosphoserine phosphatase RsbU/P